MKKDYDLFLSLFRPVGRAFKGAFYGARRAARMLGSKCASIGPSLRYKRSLYRAKCPQRSFKDLKRNHGAYGEYLVYDRLRRFDGLWLFNLYLPKDGQTTEIDELFVSPRGIFIIESKNYAGRIYGKDDQRDWTCTYRSRGQLGVKKFRFFNPFFQNSAHKTALAAILETQLPLYTLVVFGRNSQLFLDVSDKRKDELTTIGKLKKEVRKKKRASVDEDEPARVYEALKRYTKVSAFEKYKHIEAVADKSAKLPKV